MKYEQRDIVEVNFMFPDGTFKPHPALIVSNNELQENEGYIYLCMISTKDYNPQYTFALSDDIHRRSRGDGACGDVPRHQAPHLQAARRVDDTGRPVLHLRARQPHLFRQRSAAHITTMSMLLNAHNSLIISPPPAKYSGRGR